MNTIRLFCILCGIAWSLAADAATNSTETILLSGTVVDAQGRAVPGAVVECRQSDNIGKFILGDPEMRQVGTVTTTSNGAFQIHAPNGVTSLLARKKGFSLGWGMWYMAISRQEAPIQIILTAPTSVSGTVRDTGGKPVPNARVWVDSAFQSRPEENGAQPFIAMYSASGRSCLSARTGRDGTFRIDDLPSDATLDLAVEKPGMALDQPARSSFDQNLTYRAGDSNIVLTLKPAGVIEGRVVGEKGAPVAGAQVLLQDTIPTGFPRNQRPASLSGPDGAFRIPDLGEGEYSLRTLVDTNQPPEWVCDTVTVTVEAGATNRDVKITASRGGLVEVTVNDLASHPVPNASVFLAHQFMPQAATTSDRGIARMRVLPGDYTVLVYKPDMNSHQSSVTVEQGQTNRIDVVLESSPRLSGSVTDPDGKPAANVKVAMFPNSVGEQQTDLQGRFALSANQFGGRQPNPRVIIARDLSRNLATAVEAEEDGTNAALRLQPALTLAGRVINANGKPVTNAEAQAIFHTERMGFPLGKPTHVGPDGRFEIVGLPTGYRYDVHVSAKGYGQSTRPVETQENARRRIELDPVSLALANLHVAGVVLGADDKPVARAWISSFGQEQPQVSGRTDAKGRFSFDQVCAGPIQLSANDQNRSAGSATAEGGDTNIVIHLGTSEQFFIGQATSRISGAVVDADGKPAPNIAISVLPSSQSGEKHTDAEGHFSTSYSASQYFNGRAGQPVVVARDTARDLAAAFQVEEDAAATNLMLRLQPALTFAGRVTDVHSKAITNAQVQVMLLAEHIGSGLGPPIRTDADGRFQIQALPPGQRYGVNATAKGFGQDNRMVEAPENGTRRVELDPFQLAVADQRIAGMVLDDNDKPVAHCSVNTYGEHQPSVVSQTDAKGQFTMNGICAGAIRIFVSNQTGGSGQATAEGGDTNLVIHVSTSPRMRPEQPRRASLKGRPLPDLTTVNLAGDAVPSGKPVLLCLFDVGQRPSRHFIGLLKERHGALSQKGITVLGVQYAIIADDAFQGWKDANPVPFPVGRVTEKSQKTRWATEAESLPWLILTDADRKVAAEGFPLEELDAKLKSIEK